MSKTAKMWIVVAAVLVALGMVLFAGVMAAYDWDFTKLSTITYETNIYQVSGTFDIISIDVNTTEIEFIPTDDEDCSIVCFEAEKVKHSATVQNGTLVINTLDTRKWYDHIGISLGTPKMTVFLPQNEYNSLFIETDTGDITISEDFMFETLEIKGDTSDIKCYASVTNIIEVEVSTGNIEVGNISAGQLNLATTTGGIKISSATVKNNIDIETDTGSVKLTDISCADFIAEGDTGTISLKNVIATEKISIENDVGDIKFEGSDAAEIYFKTSTGDVAGTLLSEKIFITDTSTGRISVPKTTTGGKCEIKTSTGDIEIAIENF